MLKDKKYVVGVDVGGQTTKIGVTDASGNISARTVIRTDIYGEDADAYLKALADAILSCIQQSDVEGAVKGVGVGAPNSNYYTGEISNAANLAWANNTVVKFSEKLSALLGGIPVSLTNDANAAAIGEMVYGSAKGMKDFIMITLGTGVGSGIVIDGKLLYGHDGFAGELGHVTVDRSEKARLCGCGHKGCLETYCSAIGVARTAREWLDTTDEPSSLRSLESISSKDVYQAAQAGDALALRVFDFTGKLLGRSMADFVKFSAPEAIVLFGGLTKAREFFYLPMLKEMNDNLLPIWQGKVKVLFSSLSESDAAILGASALAW